MRHEKAKREEWPRSDAAKAELAKVLDAQNKEAEAEARLSRVDAEPVEKNPPWKPEYQAERGTSKIHADAFRRRSAMVGLLLSCICTYPIEIDSTTHSGHSKFCPAHKMGAGERSTVAHEFVGTATGECGECGEGPAMYLHREADS